MKERIFKLIASITIAVIATVALSNIYSKLTYTIYAQQTGLPPATSQIYSIWPCTTSLPLMSIANGTPSCVAASAVTAAQIADAMTPYMWYNAVIGSNGPQMDPTGVSDSAALLQTWINGKSSGNWALFIPCGTYKWGEQVTIPATSSAYPNIYIHGAAPSAQQSNGCVIFDAASGYAANTGILQYDNTSVGAGQQRGPHIDNIQFQGLSNGTIAFGYDVVQANNSTGENLSFVNLTGTVYSTGTATAVNGSTSVTGIGTTWTSGMAGPPGEFCQSGECQLIATINSTTSLTLVSQWQFSTTSSQAYAIPYNGAGLLFDGGNAASGVNYAQYGEYRNINAQNTRITIATHGTNNSNYGVSRISIFGGWSNCNRLDHSSREEYGGYTDTMLDVGGKANNCTEYALVESSHEDHWVSIFNENNSSYAPNSTCPGSPSQACTRGIEINSDATNKAYGNNISSSYMYNVGNPFQIDSDNVLRTVISENALPEAGVNTNIDTVFLTSGAGMTSTEVWDHSMHKPEQETAPTVGAACNTAPYYNGYVLFSGSNVYICNGTWSQH